MLTWCRKMVLEVDLKKAECSEKNLNRRLWKMTSGKMIGRKKSIQQSISSILFIVVNDNY